MSNSVTPWTAACQASLSLTISRSCSNSCPLSRWCHPTISSSVALFSSCPQSFPESGSFPMIRLFTSGRQSIGVSSSASVFQWIFRIDFLLDGLVWSPCSPRDSQESYLAPQFKSIIYSGLNLLLVRHSHTCMTTEKSIAFTGWTFSGKMMSLSCTSYSASFFFLLKPVYHVTLMVSFPFLSCMCSLEDHFWFPLSTFPLRSQLDQLFDAKGLASGLSWLLTCLFQMVYYFYPWIYRERCLILPLTRTCSGHCKVIFFFS